MAGRPPQAALKYAATDVRRPNAFCRRFNRRGDCRFAYLCFMVQPVRHRDHVAITPVPSLPQASSVSPSIGDATQNPAATNGNLPTVGSSVPLAQPLPAATTATPPTQQAQLVPAIAPVTTTATPASISVTTPAPAETPVSPTASEKQQPTPAVAKEPAKEQKEQPAKEQPAKEQPAVTDTDKSRVSIRADKESWVLIVDNHGSTVIDRIVKAGEIVKVPNQKGLKLTTGNAGGITLNVDGTDLPALGEASHVIRGVALDPEKLKNP